LLGCHEGELHHLVERIIRTSCSTVVNIGSGEGYYAVGLARSLPAARVHAFDRSEAARLLCAELARINGVADRVVIAGECTSDRLAALAGPGTLIWCDCEGCEATLLDPARVPGLAGCDILVEVHEAEHPGITEVLRGRFEVSHEVIWIEHAGRDAGPFGVLRGLSQLDQLVAVWEGRGGPTPWAWLTARSRRG
jgi:hypothetical protein